MNNASKPKNAYRITNKMIEKASDAYAEYRHPQIWDGPPWGEAGRQNHKLAIKAALKTLLEEYKLVEKKK